MFRRFNRRQLLGGLFGLLLGGSRAASQPAPSPPQPIAPPPWPDSFGMSVVTYTYDPAGSLTTCLGPLRQVPSSESPDSRVSLADPRAADEASRQPGQEAGQ